MSSRNVFICPGLSLLGVLICLASAARAEVSIESVEVGVGGVTRPGIWTQLQVQLQSTEQADCRVEIVAADPTGNPATYPSTEFTLYPKGSTPATVFFMPGRLDETITVNVVATDGAILASKRLVSGEPGSDQADFFVVRHTVPIWVVAGTIGGNRKGKSDQETLRKSLADRGVHVAQLQSASECPDRWRALSAVTTVVLSGTFNLTPDQSSALSQWVLNGGHVVVIAGTRIEELTNSPIADWVLSDREVTASSLSDLTGLEAFSNSSFRIPIVARIKGSVISIQDGTDVVNGIEGPLLTRSAHGFGRITMLGVDLDRPPLSRWRAIDSFIAAVADLPPVELNDESNGQRISHTGITEMATQLQVGMETIPQVGERSTLSVLGLVLLFLLIVGPLDYLLVHRLLKKPGLTWMTFPSIVIAAALLATSVAGGANGKVIRSRLCEVIDLDASSGFTRQTIWSSIYSPEHRRYRVQIDHDPQSLTGDVANSSTDTESATLPMTQPGWLHWVAAPEENFGSMYRASGINPGGAAYTFSEGRSTINNLPIPAASDRILASTTTTMTSPDLFEVQLKQAGTGHLSRDSTFTHHLPGAIDEWLLVYGNRAYFHDYRGGDLLGSSAIEPGVVWTATGKTTGGRELRSYLTGSTFQRTDRNKGDRAGGAEFEYSQVDWNRRETDLQTILRMVTFYQIAGGRDYTGLLNDAFSNLELSDSLPLDRAVLIGRLNRSGATVQIDGQPLQPDLQESFVRVLLPVEDAPVELKLPDFDK